MSATRFAGVIALAAFFATFFGTTLGEPQLQQTGLRALVAFGPTWLVLALVHVFGSAFEGFFSLFERKPEARQMTPPPVPSPAFQSLAGARPNRFVKV